MQVATPEATALDLFRYLKSAGHIGHVATVLVELAEKIDPQRLMAVAKAEGELPTAQRLGHVLDQVGHAERAHALASWIAEEQPRYVALRPDRSIRRASKDPRWKVLVNEKIEVDL